jgi:hypothetical protein
MCDFSVTDHCTGTLNPDMHLTGATTGLSFSNNTPKQHLHCESLPKEWLGLASNNNHKQWNCMATRFLCVCDTAFAAGQLHTSMRTAPGPAADHNKPLGLLLEGCISPAALCRTPPRVGWAEHRCCCGHLPCQWVIEPRRHSQPPGISAWSSWQAVHTLLPKLSVPVEVHREMVGNNIDNMVGNPMLSMWATMVGKPGGQIGQHLLHLAPPKQDAILSNQKQHTKSTFCAVCLSWLAS